MSYNPVTNWCLPEQTKEDSLNNENSQRTTDLIRWSICRDPEITNEETFSP